jgi:hypothetical protein
VAIWINGGLEAPLIMFLLMLALHYSLPYIVSASEPSGLSRPRQAFSSLRALAAGSCLGLVALTRPDGILFAWAISLALLTVEYLHTPAGPSSSMPRRLITATRKLFTPLFFLNAVVLVFYTGQLLFRLRYYGEWVPNTALVKIGFTITRVSGGLVYVARMLAVFVPFIGLLLLYRRKAGRPAAQVFFVVIIAVVSLYLALIGGDIFPGYRHVLPLIPLLCAVAAMTMMDLHNRLNKNKTVYYIAAFSLLVFVIGVQFADNRNRDGKKERWEWNGMGLGQTLQKGFDNEQPSMATTAAGALPFYAGLPTLDMLGLNDYYLPRHPPANFGKGYLGHELGDAVYYLKQSPDIFFLFGLGSPTPYFSGETDMFSDSSFKTDYARVRLLYHLEHNLLLPAWQSGILRSVTLHDSCYMFIKKNSARIGIRVDNRQVIIPSYFLKNILLPDSSATTYLNKDGEFVISIAPGEKYFLDSRRLYSFLQNQAIPAKNMGPLSTSKDLLLSHNENQLQVYNTSANPVECKEIRIQL